MFLTGESIARTTGRVACATLSVSAEQATGRVGCERIHISCCPAFTLRMCLALCARSALPPFACQINTGK